jgi:hypothetical protein
MTNSRMLCDGGLRSGATGLSAPQRIDNFCCGKQAPVPLDRLLLQGGLRFRPRLRFVASVPSVVLLMPQRSLAVAAPKVRQTTASR